MKFFRRKILIFLTSFICFLVLICSVFWTSKLVHLFDVFRFEFYLNTQQTLQDQTGELVGLVETGDLELALEQLDERSQSSAELLNNCHGVAHRMGHAAFEKIGKEALQYGSDLCGAGFTHGVIESYFGTFHVQDLTQEVEDICAPALELKCFHGVGHGLMIVLEGDVQKSLEYCSVVKEFPMRSNCYDGVFMSVFDNEDTGVTRNWSLFVDPWQYCKTFGEDFASHCYFYLPRYFITSSSFDAQKFAEDCKNYAPTEVYKFSCARGAGLGMTKYHLSALSQVETFCNLFSGASSQWCFDGARTYYNFHYHNLDDDFTFCEVFSEIGKEKCRMVDGMK